jgi:hypothetical protein
LHDNASQWSMCTVITSTVITHCIVISKTIIKVYCQMHGHTSIIVEVQNYMQAIDQWEVSHSEIHRNGLNNIQ